MTNLEITSAYVGSDQAVKLYLGGEAIWPSSTPPVPPVEDPMLRQPLTVEITSVGTAATPQFGFTQILAASGAVPTTGSAATYITYTINDGEPQELVFSADSSNTAKTITKAITGIAVGDVIRFYASSGKTFMSVRAKNRHGLGLSTSEYLYFVHTSGFETNVYGNINSLLVTKDEFDQYAAGDDTVAFNASAYTYEYLFSGRTGFDFGTPSSEKHIVLPEPTNGLVDYCYCGMFDSCSNLTSAPALPATTLAESCYREMYYGAGLTGVSADYLPATALSPNCYRSMFSGCTSLTSAPELPATTLADSCYYGMFYRCSGLTTAPELPSTTLAASCYTNMFAYCTSLTTAPELPATTLADSCYYDMFYSCTSLTTAPELPATTLANGCYLQMFAGCTSLTSAPALPATTLADNCYRGMFYACSGLTTAPELPATTLVSTCYYQMFSNCTSLNYIKCLATSGISTTNTRYWVSRVASSGTFVKAANATWTTGNNGIPSNWTVEDAE